MNAVDTKNYRDVAKVIVNDEIANGQVREIERERQIELVIIWLDSNGRNRIFHCFDSGQS